MLGIRNSVNCLIRIEFYHNKFPYLFLPKENILENSDVKIVHFLTHNNCSIPGDNAKVATVSLKMTTSQILSENVRQ